MPNHAEQINYYENLLDKHGPNYLALDWNSPESQKLRFEILKEIFIYGKKACHISLLDVGCGLGDLYGFLKTTRLLQQHKINYTGIDISPKLIAAAQKKYPEVKFAVKDIMEDASLTNSDYIFCSGLFGIRTLDLSAHLEYVKSMLLRMYSLVNYGVGVNFLSEGGLPVDRVINVNAGRYFYFNPENVINFCRSVCDNYIIRHDYQPGDFTVYLLK